MRMLVSLSIILAASLSFASSPTPSEEEAKPKAGEISKSGFLTTEACIKKGEFVDCNLETLGKSPFVIYVHDENIAYKLDTQDVLVYPLYEDVGKNNAKVVGIMQGETIKVRAYTPAPPEVKSFLKGCM